MEDSEEEEQEEEASEEFNVIPPYSEKDSDTESGARGSQRGAANQAVPVYPLLLLPALIIDWKCWSYWSLHLILHLHFTLATAVKSISALRMDLRGLSSKRNVNTHNTFSFLFSSFVSQHFFLSVFSSWASSDVKRYL